MRQHAREASFRAKDEREQADELAKKLREANATLANSSIYSSKCDTEEEVALMVKENVQEEVVLAKTRWELTRSRVLAGAVISYEARMAITLKNEAQKAEKDAAMAGSARNPAKMAEKEAESKELWSEANKRVGVAKALSQLESDSAEFQRAREDPTAKYVRTHDLGIFGSVS